MKANDMKILDFISGRNKAFVIPPFQRNYEWGIEQCDELFDDLILAFKNKKSHYLGNIIYYLGQNSGASFQELILVDGQQRITSILLLLCAIRDLISDETIKQTIDCDYLKNRISNEKYRIRLKQTAYDSACFDGIVSGNIGELKSNTAINYEHFKKRIADADISVENIYDALELFEIVDINLNIENDLGKVQTVFEKINSTGKRLEPADLIRNYLLLSGSVNEQEVLYTNYWLKIEEEVKNEYISRFAKDFLILNLFCDIPREQIYKVFRKHFDSTGESHEYVLQEMLRLSKYYKWLLNEECPNKEINLCIKYLNYLKTNDLYPLYLYLFDNLYEENRKELNKILSLLSDFMLRYRVVSPSNGGGALRAVVHNI